MTETSWLTQEAHDRLKAELDELGGESPGDRRGDQRPPRRGRPQGERRLPRRARRAGQAGGPDPPAAGTAAQRAGRRRPRRTTASSSRAWSSPSPTTGTTTTRRRSCSAPARRACTADCRCTRRSPRSAQAILGARPRRIVALHACPTASRSARGQAVDAARPYRRRARRRPAADRRVGDQRSRLDAAASSALSSHPEPGAAPRPRRSSSQCSAPRVSSCSATSTSPSGSDGPIRECSTSMTLAPSSADQRRAARPASRAGRGCRTRSAGTGRPRPGRVE